MGNCTLPVEMSPHSDPPLIEENLRGVKNHAGVAIGSAIRN